LQVADIQQGDLVLIQTATKASLKQKAMILVSSDKDNDSGSDDDEYNSLHPELANWDNGQSNEELIQDSFKEQQDLINFG